MKTQDIELSIIIPIFRSEHTLVQLVADIQSVLGHTTHYEIFLVCDCPTDQSLLIAKQIALQDAHIHCIELAHNVGQHPATYAGIVLSRGKTIVTMDEDYQHPPTAIPTLVRLAKRCHGICYFVSTTSPQPWGRLILSRAARRLYYRCFPHTQLPQGATSFRAFQGHTRSLFCKYHKQHPVIIDAILSQLNHPTLVHKGPSSTRKSGRSGYNLLKLLRFSIRCYIAFHQSHRTKKSGSQEFQRLPWIPVITITTIISILLIVFSIAGLFSLPPLWSLLLTSLLIWIWGIGVVELWSIYQANNKKCAIYHVQQTP